ncbi:hypothetical protein I552_7669 [Mycobacterium xenopi 3993]|nr:hypothetical protein I552_7669 [Mycobacterium xenopi 3993]
MSTSDPVVPPGVPFDQALAALGLAANSGDPADNAQSQKNQAEREAKVNDALTKFPANEDQSAQMLQQLPQMATGVAQSAAGAMGGLMNPMMQVPQQVAQVGQQAMQAAMGAFQHGAGSGAAAAEALPGELLGTGGGLDGGAAELAGAAGGAGAWVAPRPPRCSVLHRPLRPVLSQCRRPLHHRRHRPHPSRQRRREAGWPACRWCRQAPCMARGQGQRRQGRHQARGPTHGEKRRAGTGTYHHTTNRARGGQALGRKAGDHSAHPCA